MKKILMLAFMIGSFAAKAQTIDTTSVKGVLTAKLATPIKINWNDTSKAYYLNTYSMNDNLVDEALIGYSLIGYNGKVLFGGTIPLVGNDYKLWDGASLYVFTYVADKLGLGIK